MIFLPTAGRDLVTSDGDMQNLVYLALSNFPLTFTLIGLVFAGVQITRLPSPRAYTETAEAVLRWFMFFGIGMAYFYNFICHVFFGDAIAKFIGWSQSPFQAEVGWASLGYAVLGFMAFRPDRVLRVAAVSAVSCFMLGAAIGHIYQIITRHNFAPGNAGAMLWYDILVPLFAFALLRLTRCSALPEAKKL